MNDNQHTRAYASLAADGRPSVPQCGACGLAHMPPRVFCPECGSDDLGWLEVMGAAVTLYSITTSGSATLVLADLDVPGRPRIYAGVAGDGPAARIGDRGTVTVAPGPDGSRVPMIEVSGESA